MAESNRQQLREAYELIKANRKQDATRILVGVLKQERDNMDAWWLLANASDDPARKRHALEQVLRIHPDHGAARLQLDKLGASGIAAPAAPPVPTPPTSPAARSPFTNDPFTPSSSDADTDPFSGPAARADAPFSDPFDGAAARTDDPFNDPFAAPAARTDDPFNDPFAAPLSATDEPFGDPFSTAASRQATRTDDDAFGDPFATPAARRAPRKAKDDDLFGDPFAEDRPFDDAEERRKGRPPQRKRGVNPVVIVLAIIGIIAVVGCALAMIAGIAGFNMVNTAVQTAMPAGTFEAAMQEFQLAITQVGSGVVGEIVDKGTISAGQTIRATLEEDGFTNHGYVFNGTSGQNVTIELNAVDNKFDPRLSLLGPDGQGVAANDDIDFENNNLNSRIETRLSDSGRYTIVVGDSGFGGGDYELTLR